MLLIAFTLFGLLYTFKVEPLHSFSLRFNDINFVFQNRKASQDVLLVAVDEESINRFGRWPWSRDVIAKAIENLDESSTLVFDMVFSEPTSEDESLAKNIEKQANNVCGFFLRQKTTQTLSQMQMEAISDTSLTRLSSQLDGSIGFIQGQEAEANVETITKSCTLQATFSTIRDSDQLLRAYPLAFSFKNELIPSLGVQALRLAKNEDLLLSQKNMYSMGTHVMQTDERGFARLNYYPLESYSVRSFSELYDNKLSKSFLKDKIIVLGLSEVGLGDIRVTPIGEIPGALVHVTFISNVLNDELLHSNKTLTVFTLILFFLLPLIWFFITTLYGRIVVYIGTYVLLFLSAKLLYLYANLYLDTFYPLVGLLMSAIMSESYLYKIQEHKVDFLKGAFSSYLSAQLLETLMRDPSQLKLGGEKREVSIFFSDIRDFTAMSEEMDAKELTRYLNRYFTVMSDLVMLHNGMIDKYIGDAIMAFYNAPVLVQDHAKDACRSALDMLKALKTLNQEFEANNLPTVRIGIGINTAEVALGNMGSEKRFNYTVVGDGVNVASRVEGYTKNFGVNILITENTKKQIGEEFLLRALDRVQVKGRVASVMVYELLEETPSNRHKVATYLSVKELYSSGAYEQALAGFKSLENEDSVAHYFIEKIERILKDRNS